MDAALARQVWQRAGGCCEYCRMPQEFDDAPFEIDHVIARKHGGPTAAGNLALTCFYWKEQTQHSHRHGQLTLSQTRFG
jgi:hypothetical protein